MPIIIQPSWYPETKLNLVIIPWFSRISVRAKIKDKGKYLYKASLAEKYSLKIIRLLISKNRIPVSIAKVMPKNPEILKGIMISKNTSIILFASEFGLRSKIPVAATIPQINGKKINSVPISLNNNCEAYK